MHADIRWQWLILAVSASAAHVYLFNVLDVIQVGVIIARDARLPVSVAASFAEV